LAIRIEALDAQRFRVTVEDRRTTTHTVTVRPAYAEKLGGAGADAASLVQRSFEFLLEREPNTSILGEFDLSVIQRYFPDYERTIRDLSHS
jgi:hypothetical protein